MRPLRVVEHSAAKRLAISSISRERLMVTLADLFAALDMSFIAYEMGKSLLYNTRVRRSFEASREPATGGDRRAAMVNTVQPRFTPEQLKEISDSFETKRPEDVLTWGFETFGERFALASSFGGESGTVLVDMAVKINPKVKVYSIDTAFLFPETYQEIEDTKHHYGIKPIIFKSKFTPEEQAAKYGPELWKREPDLCCNLRKVEPQDRAFSEMCLEAWGTGVRRDQASTRSAAGIVEWNTKFNMVKLNPVAHWNKQQIWKYIADNNLKYNPLLDQGYGSIGCTNCTRKLTPGEDSRAGRWSGTDKIECGLNT